MKINCPNCKAIIETKEARMRTLPQNSYYWGIVIKLLSDELGYSPWEAHEILKALFLTELKILKTKNGIKEVRTTKSTAGLSTTEFEEYQSTIRIFASSELGIWIPEPNESL